MNNLKQDKFFIDQQSNKSLSLEGDSFRNPDNGNHDKFG